MNTVENRTTLSLQLEKMGPNGLVWKEQIPRSWKKNYHTHQEEHTLNCTLYVFSQLRMQNLTLLPSSLPFSPPTWNNNYTIYRDETFAQ